MKTILVIGASKGLGKNIVSEAISAGYFVVFTYNKNKNSALKIYRKNKKKCLAFKLDLNNNKNIKNIFLNLKKRKINIDCLINNAANKPKRKNFVDIKNNEIINIFKINFFSIIEIIKYFLTFSKRNKYKKLIINISSYSARSGGYKLTHYASSKSAIETLTKGLAKELKVFNTNIVCISPYKIIFNKKNKINSNVLIIVKKIISLVKKNHTNDTGKIFYFK